MPSREVSGEGLQASVQRCGAQHQTLSPRLHSHSKAGDSAAASRREVAVRRGRGGEGFLSRIQRPGHLSHSVNKTENISTIPPHVWSKVRESGGTA